MTETAIPVRKSGFLRVVSNLLQLLVVLALVPVGMALFVAYLLLRLLFAAVIGVVRGLFHLTLYTVTHLLEILLGFGMTFFIGALGIWLFWRINPEFRATMQSYRAEADQWMREHLGFPVPRLPGPGEAAALVERPQKVPEKETLYDALGPEAIPPELAPLAHIAQDHRIIERYKYLIWTGQIGQRADAAVPLLSEALAGPDKDLARAARAALLKIGTPEAKQAVRGNAGRPPGPKKRENGK